MCNLGWVKRRLEPFFRDQWGQEGWIIFKNVSLGVKVALGGSAAWAILPGGKKNIFIDTAWVVPYIHTSLTGGFTFPMHRSPLYLLVRGLLIAFVSLNLFLACPDDQLWSLPHCDAHSEQCHSENPLSTSVQSTRKTTNRQHLSFGSSRSIYADLRVPLNLVPSAITSSPFTDHFSVILRIWLPHHHSGSICCRSLLQGISWLRGETLSSQSIWIGHPIHSG